MVALDSKAVKFIPAGRFLQTRPNIFQTLSAFLIPVYGQSPNDRTSESEDSKEQG